MRPYMIPTAALLVTLSSSGNAVDENACAADMVCASSPASVATALQGAGYRAELKKDEVGEFISSAAGGYNFLISFIGCREGIKCDSLQFSIVFKPHPDQTAEYANGFNLKYRYLQAAARENKELRLTYDLNTMGGVTRRNFTDVVDMWSRGLGSFTTYVRDEAAKKIIPAPPAPPTSAPPSVPPPLK